MFSNLTAMAGREAGRFARDTARRAASIVVALIFVAIALMFAGVAMFLWLSTAMAAPLAGLAVAGLALLSAIISLLLGTRRRRSPAYGAPLAGLAADQTRNLAAEAEALGVKLGREMKGYPLVATAFVIGMLLGGRRR